MAWLILFVSGILETVWATALSHSKGLTRPVPAAIFVVSMAVSLIGLGYAMRSIPVGTGYAVWVGIGTIGTAIYGMAALGDAVTTARIVCLVMIVAGVAGLKLAN
jgi:quaternary ammonium compound-resistance protein SugE